MLADTSVEFYIVLHGGYKILLIHAFHYNSPRVARSIFVTIVPIQKPYFAHEIELL